MKSTGIVRRLDELGRITLPIELRRNFDVNERDPLEIFVDVYPERTVQVPYSSPDVHLDAASARIKPYLEARLARIYPYQGCATFSLSFRIRVPTTSILSHRITIYHRSYQL